VYTVNLFTDHDHSIAPAPEQIYVPPPPPKSHDKWGIGLLLGNTQDGTGQDVEVCDIIPGFAAEHSDQFDVGDVVLFIDGILVRGMPLAEVKQLTIGEVGTEVTLIMRSFIEVSSVDSQAFKKKSLPVCPDLPLTRVFSVYLFVHITSMPSIMVEICHIFMTPPRAGDTYVPVMADPLLKNTSSPPPPFFLYNP
jgi:hypothetical protein